MLSGAISGLIFWLIMYPIDCVKTSLQLKKTLSESLQALRLTRLRGYNIVLLRSMIVNSSSFFIYEQCHKLSHLLASPYYSMY